MFLGLSDPHPDPISQRYGSGAFYRANSKKTLITTFFLDFFMTFHLRKMMYSKCTFKK